MPFDRLKRYPGVKWLELKCYRTKGSLNTGIYRCIYDEISFLASASDRIIHALVPFVQLALKVRL